MPKKKRCDIVFPMDASHGCVAKAAPVRRRTFRTSPETRRMQCDNATPPRSRNASRFRAKFPVTTSLASRSGTASSACKIDSRSIRPAMVGTGRLSGPSASRVSQGCAGAGGRGLRPGVLRLRRLAMMRRAAFASRYFNRRGTWIADICE